MKVSVIIIGLLAVTMVHGFDMNQILRHQKALVKCSVLHKQSAEKPTKEVILCKLQMLGLLNKNKELILGANLELIKDIVNDVNVKKAQQIITECHKEVVKSGLTGEKQTLKIIECALSVMKFISYKPVVKKT